MAWKILSSPEAWAPESSEHEGVNESYGAVKRFYWMFFAVWNQRGYCIACLVCEASPVALALESSEARYLFKSLAWIMSLQSRPNTSLSFSVHLSNFGASICGMRLHRPSADDESRNFHKLNNMHFELFVLFLCRSFCCL